MEKFFSPLFLSFFPFISTTIHLTDLTRHNEERSMGYTMLFDGQNSIEIFFSHTISHVHQERSFFKGSNFLYTRSNTFFPPLWPTIVLCDDISESIDFDSLCFLSPPPPPPRRSLPCDNPNKRAAVKGRQNEYVWNAACGAHISLDDEKHNNNKACQVVPWQINQFEVFFQLAENLRARQQQA